MLLYLNVSECCIIFWFLHSISLFSNPIVIDLFLRHVCELVHMQGTKATAFLTFMWITREIFILVGVGEGALSFHSRLIESTDVTMGKWCWGWRWLNWFRYLEEVLFIQNRHLTSSRYQRQDFNLIFKYYNDLDDWAADLGSLWVQVPYRPLSTPPPAPTRWFQVEQKQRLTALHKWWELVFWLTVTAQRGLRLVKVFFSRALSLFPSSLVIKPNVVTSAPMHSCFPANLPPAADPRSPHPPAPPARFRRLFVFASRRCRNVTKKNKWVRVSGSAKCTKKRDTVGYCNPARTRARTGVCSVRVWGETPPKNHIKSTSPPTASTPTHPLTPRKQRRSGLM